MAKILDEALHAFLNLGIRELVDAIPVALFVKDAQSRIVLMNRACEEQWGMNLTDLYGTDGSHLFPPEQMAVFLKKDQEVLSSMHPMEVVESFWNAALNENRIGQTYKRAVKDDKGKPIFLIGATADVTETYYAKADLRAIDEKLRGLYELAPMGIALTDMKGRYVEFNRAFQRICGYSLEELNNLDYWALTPTEYAEQEAAQLDALAQRGCYGPYEKEYIRKDGSRIPLRLNGVLIHGRDGEPYIWSIVEDITERKQKDELIWRQANFDMVTNLPNRRLFRDRLEHEIRKARRTNGQIALFFIDLDHFKDINDTFGHSRGDQLLADAGQRICACVRETDTVARPGGDEFAVILNDFSGVENLERIARDILDALHVPFDLGHNNAHVSASIGIAIFPDDASDLDTLLIYSDQAMYLAKSQGRDRFAYFTESMQRKADEKRALVNDLRLALARNELVVYYQPIVDSGSGKIVKAEALLRWQHPTRGIVPPVEFIPLAEESGLILEIGEWVFGEAIKAVDAWFRRFACVVETSVNMSPMQFADQSRSGEWLKHLQGLPSRSIAVEITESMLLLDTDSVKRRLLELRNMGVQVSIDDFGTGFSALSYLKKFDIDYLKIDRAFTSGLLEDASDRALTEAIIVMAHKLGIKTIAEGVETEAQRDILLHLGSDYMQGYLYSRPVTFTDFEALLAREYHDHQG